MRYTLLCLCLLMLIACKQEDGLVPEEEEIIVEEDDEQGAPANTFPFLFPVPDNYAYSNIPNSIHPAVDGGVYLVGNVSGMNLKANGELNWTSTPECFYDRNKQAVFRTDIQTQRIRVFQINNQGEAQVIHDFSNPHGVNRSSQVLQMGSSIYFYWRTGQQFEEIVHMVSLDLEGKLNWQKELTFGDYVYPEIIAHNGQLYVPYDIYAGYQVGKVSVAVLDDSGNVVNDFSLRTNLEGWNQPEPLVKLEVDDNYVYSNTTKNDAGLNRRSRIAKYTYSGELMGEIEVDYAKDFFVENQSIYTIGNDYEIDPDLRTGFPFVIKMDENLNVLTNRRIPDVSTASTKITISDDLVYVSIITSNSGIASGEILLVDTLHLR